MKEKLLNKISAKNEIDKCLLCHEATCTEKCPHGLDPAKAIRSLRFDNIYGGVKCGSDICQTCEEKSCIKACIKGKIDWPIAIPELMIYANNLSNKDKDVKKVDLEIEFCGISFENPFLLSSSVVASNYEMVAKAFDMGWAGAAFKTIGTFVPDEVSPRFSTISKEGNSFIGLKNIEQISDHTLDENLAYLKRLKEDYPSKVIIASILGRTEEEWTFLAQKMTEVGVDIIECNFSCPHMSGKGLGSDVGQDPQLVAEYTRATRKGTHLPILAKMTPNIGNMEIPALAAIKSGATGIAAINTIKSIMNIDLDDFTSAPNVDGKSAVGGYSGKTVKPIALRFIHDMKKYPELQSTPISGMGGIETWQDAAEFIALGCENLQVTTAVMQYGYRIIEDLIEGLSTFLGEKQYTSLQELVGKALPKLISAEKLNRHSIIYPKFEKEQCIGCGRCYLSCSDGGHQAIKVDKVTKKPRLIPSKCAGCHLCQLICPVNAISTSKRIEIK